MQRARRNLNTGAGGFNGLRDAKFFVCDLSGRISVFPMVGLGTGVARTSFNSGCFYWLARDCTSTLAVP